MEDPKIEMWQTFTVGLYAIIIALAMTPPLTFLIKYLMEKRRKNKEAKKIDNWL